MEERNNGGPRNARSNAAKPLSNALRYANGAPPHIFNPRILLRKDRRWRKIAITLIEGRFLPLGGVLKCNRLITTVCSLGALLIARIQRMGRTVYILHSNLAPASVPIVLQGSMDAERRSLFSLSGYKGDRPLVGSVVGDTFSIQKRRYSRNDFAGRFYGRFEPEAGGTRIEGYFDPPEWTRWFMRIWLGLAILLGVPVFIAAVIEVAKGAAAREQVRGSGLLFRPP